MWILQQGSQVCACGGCEVAPFCAPLQGKTVEDMLAEWDAELDKRSRAFQAHAVALADWDRAILSNRHGLLALEEQLCKVCLHLSMSATLLDQATFCMHPLKCAAVHQASRSGTLNIKSVLAASVLWQHGLTAVSMSYSRFHSGFGACTLWRVPLAEHRGLGRSQARHMAACKT